MCEDSAEHVTSKYSPGGFAAPTVEVEQGDVVCAGCGDSTPAEEMGATADDVIETEDGAVVQVTRVYLHENDDCVRRFVESQVQQDDQGGQDDG